MKQGLSSFDIIGPIMAGPSSSHTAGAVRLGRMARLLLGEEPKKARILLHGSFLETYRGHGTDLALMAGLLGGGQCAGCRRYGFSRDKERNTCGRSNSIHGSNWPPASGVP